MSMLCWQAARAQQVAITSVTPNPVCAGATITVTYSYTLPDPGTVVLYLNGPNTTNVPIGAAATNGGNGVVAGTIPADRPTGSFTVFVIRSSTILPNPVNSPNSSAFTINGRPAAPGVASLAYCLGTTGVPPLTATGQNLKWYTASTGGTGSTTAPTPPTSTAGTTNYYVSQTSTAGCEGPRATLAVTINPRPAQPTVVSSVSYCQNSTAPSLTAAVTSGSNLKWYTSATGGTGSSVAPTPQTSTVTTTTYYVSQTDGNGCESNRAAITVTIKASPAPPAVTTPVTYCQGQTATPLSATPVSGGSLNWFGPSNNSLGSTAPTPPATSPGTTFYSVSQTLSGCSSTAATITVTINSKPAVPTTTPVGVCQGTTPISLATGVTSGTNLRWYTTSVGGTASTVAPTPSTGSIGSTTYYVSQVNANGCESDRAVITYTVNAYPAAPAVSPNSLTYCQNSTAVPLTATPATSATLTYYTVAVGGTPYTSLTPLTNQSNNYYVSQTLNNCEGPRATIGVVINALPARPAVTTPVAYCQFTIAAPLSATASTNNTLSWYGTNATGGTASTAAPTPPTTTDGAFTYYVSQKDPFGCESQRAPISVTIYPKPAAPTITPASACLNSVPAPLAQSVTATGTLKWYTTQTGGTGSTVAPTLSTSAVGSSTYYVSQTNANGCEGDRSAITFTVNSLPAAPVPTPTTLLYCQNATAQPLTATGQNLKWYAVSNGGTQLASPVIPSTSLAGPPVTYYVSQTNANGCESPRASVTVTTVSRPAPPTVNALPVTYCQFATPASLSATPITGNTLRWFGPNETGGTASSTATVPVTDPPGTTRYYVSQTDGNGCESSSRAFIPVTVYAKPTAPTVNSVTLCQNAAPVSLATAVTAGINLKWYAAQSGGTGATTAPPLSTAALGSTTYYVSQTSADGCESDRSAILVTVKPLPVAPTITANTQNLCQSSVPTPLTAIATGTLKWYDSSGQTYTSITPLTNAVGPTSYSVSQIVNGCEGPKATLNVVVIPKPVVPTVSSSLAVCQLSTPTSLSATGQNLKWYTDPTGGTASATAPIPPTSASATTVYYVTQTDGNGCESDRASISVRVKPKPGVPGTAAISVCSNQVTPLTATFDAGTTPNWYGTNATSGTATSIAPTPSTAVIGAAVLYYVSQTLEGCESDRASIAVTIKALPVAPTVSSNPVAYCQNAIAAPLSATAASNGSLNWYTTQTGGVASSTALVPQTSSSQPPTGYYYVSQTVDGCEGPRATIAVTISPTPALPTVVSSLSYCQNATAAVLTATGSSGSTLKWYNDPTTPTTIPTPTPLTTTPGPTVYYVSQTNTNSCESSRASITVNIIATPAAPGVSSLSLCQNAVATALTASTSPGGILNWYGTNASGGTASLAAPTPPTSIVGPVTYYVSQRVNGCEGPRASLDVTIKPVLTAPTVTNNAVSFCQNAVATALSATPASTGTLNWYINQGGVLSPLGQVAPIPSTATVGVLTYSVSQNTNGCEGPQASIVVTIKTLPAAPTVATGAVIFCQNSTASALTAGFSPGGTLNWYTTSTGGVPSAIAPIPSTATPGLTTYYVSQSINGCESPLVPLVVIIKVTPSAPTVGTAPIYCQGGTATALSAVAPDGGSLSWYTTPTGGTPSPTPPVPPVTTVGVITYYVSQNLDGCEGPRVSLTATIKAAPAAPFATPSVAYCQGVAAVALTASPASGDLLNWYTTPTGGSPSPVAPVPPTSSPGSTQYYVSQTDVNGCESVRSAIAVKINALPAVPSTAPVTYCQASVATALTATLTGGVSLNWYTTAAGGIASPMAPVPVSTSPGSTPYYVSQTDANGCESNRNMLLVTVTPAPSEPVVAVIAPVCQNIPSFPVQAAGQSLKWYTDPTTTASLGGAVLQSTVQPGTFIYYVSQTVNLCEGPRAQALVVVNALPAMPLVANQTGCQDAVVQPLTATGTALQWYDTNDNQIAAPIPVTKVDVAQTYTYKVTQTLNGCTSPKAMLTYTVNVTPLPTVVPVVAYCQNSVAKPLQATGSNLTWTDPTGIISANAPIPSTVDVTVGNSYSVTQTSVLGCESRPAKINVVINAQAAAKLAGDASVYLGSPALLTLTLTGAGPYSYTLSDGTSGIAETSTTSETTIKQVSVVAPATTTYTIMGVANACGIGSSSGAATVTVKMPTVTTSTLSASSVCTGSSFTVPFATTGEFVTGNAFTVEIASTIGNSASQKYIPISNGVVQGPFITTTIPGTVAPGQYYVRVVASNGPFAIAGTLSPTILTVRPLSTAGFTANKQTIYKGESVILVFNLGGDGPWTGTYLAGTEIRVFGTNTSVYSTTLAPATTTTYKLLSIANGCGTGKIEGIDTTTVRVDILTAEEDLLGNSVKVYPVPTEGAVTVDIDLSLQNKPATLRLISPSGHVTEQITTKKRQTILDLNKQPAGTYLLYITVGDRSTVRKILKW